MAGGTHVGDASETHNRIRDLHLTDGKANIYSSTRDHGNLPQCCSIEKNESKLLCPSYTIDFLCESSAVASNYGDVNDARYEWLFNDPGPSRDIGRERKIDMARPIVDRSFLVARPCSPWAACYPREKGLVWSDMTQAGCEWALGAPVGRCPRHGIQGESGGSEDGGAGGVGSGVASLIGYGEPHRGSRGASPASHACLDNEGQGEHLIRLNKW